MPRCPPKVPPVLIGTSEMTFDGTGRSIGLKNGWEMGRIQSERTGWNKRRKGPSTHERMHTAQIVNEKMLGLIHVSMTPLTSQRDLEAIWLDGHYLIGSEAIE